MPSNITYSRNQYQIPRGRIFFDPFDINGNLTGERYLGNCPAFTLSIETEKAEHYSSERGLREKDMAITLEVNRTASLTCDNMSAQNVALFLAGSEESVAQTSDAVVEEPINAVIPGRYYQIGQTAGNPAGVRNISTLVVTDDDSVPVTFVSGTDYEVDTDLGRLHIIEGGAIASGTNLLLSYSKTVETWERIKTGADAELNGAIRFVADNASGGNRDFYMPSVTLTPEGELPIIADGTDVATVAFSLDVLKPSNGEAIYIDGRPAE